MAKNTNFYGSEIFDTGADLLSSDTSVIEEESESELGSTFSEVSSEDEAMEGVGDDNTENLSSVAKQASVSNDIVLGFLLLFLSKHRQSSDLDSLVFFLYRHYFSFEVHVIFYWRNVLR